MPLEKEERNSTVLWKERNVWGCSTTNVHLGSPSSNIVQSSHDKVKLSPAKLRSKLEGRGKLLKSFEVTFYVKSFGFLHAKARLEILNEQYY
ncbi:unnamed protein product [Allacma fusca]|uniref:Uncharacterized protein n=1 Tax=Allacma fusca TaxID=39272 RepID=A0A8J2NVY5_9HEXA|nr:unnamed protein product [Allacma fusca]